MIYLREEGGVIRNGLNFYPRQSKSVGVQLRLGKLRIGCRYSKRTGKIKAYCGWVQNYDYGNAPYTYIPGYTETLKKACGRKNKDFETWAGKNEPE